MPIQTVFMEWKISTKFCKLSIFLKDYIKCNSLSNILDNFLFFIFKIVMKPFLKEGLGWLNELGSWIT